jgi:predicted PurR-regulated permease PerM
MSDLLRTSDPRRRDEAAPRAEPKDHERGWERRWPPASYVVRTTAIVAVTLLAVSAARSAVGIIVLVVIAAVLAIGMDPMVAGLQRRGLGRGAAVAAVVLGVLGVLALIILLIVPPLVRQIADLANGVPSFVRRLQARQDWIGSYARANDLQTRAQTFIRDLPAQLAASFDTVLGIAGRVGSTLFKTVTVAILTVYFMTALPSMRRTVTILVNPSDRDRAQQVTDRAIDRIGGYVSGNLVTSLLCAVASLAALLLLGIPFAFPLAAWAGLADLIPAVGSYLGAAPAILVGLSVSPWLGLAVAIYFLLYQQFENYVIVPRVMKGAVDLSPAAVIVSTLVGARLGGFAGALLALPVAATIKVAIVEIWLRDRMREGDPLAGQRFRQARAAERRAARREKVGSWIRRHLATRPGGSADPPV